MGLGPAKLDRIILRDVFHHLNHPEDILSSAREHLKENGYLIVNETTTDIVHGAYKLCKEATTHDIIVKAIEAQGFKLAEKKIVNYSYLMKFKKVKS